MKPETKFQNKFLKKIREIPRVWAVKISQRSISGTPDVLICANGYFIAAELKADEKSLPTKLQTLTLLNIDKAGGVALVCHPENFDEVLGIIMAKAEGRI